MKNLIPYKNDCFEVHKNAIEKKRDADLKERLNKLNPQVEVEYEKYIQEFETNTLSKLIANSSLAESKTDLLSLYSYQSSIIRAVRKDIQKLQIKTIINTCQNCTIDSINTMDHVLPQSAFPEFVVNPKNLFPSCSTCNTHKLNNVESDDERRFLNLYLDNLPQEQYLFVKIFTDSETEFNFEYYLENVDSKINASLFKIIENHYKYLNLFERMRLKSIEYISELDTEILTFKDKLGVSDIVDSLIKAANIEKEAYGYNHWKCILEITLLSTPIFINKY